MLMPSDEEQQSEWMAGFIEMEDDADTQIDSLEKQLRKVTVLRPCDGLPAASPTACNDEEAPAAPAEANASSAANAGNGEGDTQNQSQASIKVPNSGDRDHLLQRISSLEKEMADIKDIRRALKEELNITKAVQRQWLSFLGRRRGNKRKAPDSKVTAHRFETAKKRLNFD